MIFFDDLWILWVLLPVLGLWAAIWFTVERLSRRGKRVASSAVRFSSLSVLQRIKRSHTLWLRNAVRSLRVITVALLAIAMARPQTGKKHTEVITEGIDIVLVIDTSGSMQALDLDSAKRISKRKNRLEVVKRVVDDFVKKRPNDQIGMVVFGTEAFTQCPLTLDHGIVATFLDRVAIGMAGEATAIGSAVGTAVKRLKKSKAKSKVMILLTDGRSNSGSLSPGKAAEIAKTFDIKIYTIGAGTRGKAPFIVKGGLFGDSVQWQDVEIDEATLIEMAETTGGRYFRAEDQKGLQKIYDEIDALERTEVKMKSYLEYNEQFAVFLFPALGLLFFEVLLLGTRLRKIP